MTFEAVTKSRTLRDVIVDSAAARATSTKNFLAKVGVEMPAFVESLKEAPFEIEVNPEDDKSLVLGVFALQKMLKFPERDSARGCDGKFGPYTKRAFERLSQKSYPVAHDLGESVAEPLVNETVKKRSFPHTALVGDSLAVGMGEHIPGRIKAYMGATQTGWMKTKFLRLLDQKRRGRHPQLTEVVFMGGFNDLTSTKGPKHVIANLKEMYEKARAAGLTVVACTIPDWDYEGIQKRLVRRWKNYKWGHPPGVYPYSAKQLEQQTLDVNAWIKSQKGKLVDVVVDTYDVGFDRDPDGIHRTAEGKKQMAEAVIREAGLSGTRP